MSAEIIADHGGAQRQNGRFAKAHADTAEDDCVQIVEKNRSNADHAIKNHGADEQASSAHRVRDPAGEGRKQGNAKRRHGQNAALYEVIGVGHGAEVRVHLRNDGDQQHDPHRR